MSLLQAFEVRGPFGSEVGAHLNDPYADLGLGVRDLKSRAIGVVKS
ncbi:MAG TPA: hypothetical protein VIK38_12320 [Coriobacteriia bacterium]